MSKTRSNLPATLTPAAIKDIRDILVWSTAEFGREAAARYRALLIQALRDIEADPERIGSKDLEMMVKDARTYHLSFSRNRTSGTRVKSPRHFILYRISAPSSVEVGRILHDSRDLAQHLPEEYKRL